MRRRPSLRSVAVALLLLPTTAAGANAAPAPSPRLGYDAALAAVSAPGFAGVWVDGASGRLVVSLTRPSAAAARTARADVARLLQRPDLAGKPVAVRGARYTFRQLYAWYAAMKADVLALPGAVSGDIDERGNVLRFGVTDVAASAAAVASIAAARGVPAGAVAVERDAPEPVTSLSDRTRPLIGGLAIYAATTNTCTIGFAAVLNGTKGFVTNAHCTFVTGAVNGHVFFQGPRGVNPPVGYEAVDPALGSCGPTCRYSDSIFVALFDEADYAQGFIARPTSDPTTWNGTDTYRIVAESEPVVGDSVSKVGATTGLTSGTVTQTCVDGSQRPLNLTAVPPTIRMSCQSRASYDTASGDSGGPVFRVISGNDVALVGINWGGSALGGVFSTIGNMERTNELGPLSTCATGFTC